jgi:hypothetical protein
MSLSASLPMIVRRFAPVISVRFAPVTSVRFAPVVSVSFTRTNFWRLRPTVIVSSFFTSLRRSFSAWR